MVESPQTRSAAVTMLRGSEPASASLGLAPGETPTLVPTTAPGADAPVLSDSPKPYDSSVLLAAVPAQERDISGTLLLDRYRLLKKLGEGGMGTVYLAEHVTIKKRCAIKLLNPEFAHKHDLVERFLQEARAASMIAHENVVEITDFGAAPNGSVFFVMEMLIGEDLAETIKREAPLPWSRVAPIAMQICRALAAAHNKGIVHRDMKPENCFRVERHGNADFIKVLDFGIAKVTSEDPDGAGGRLTSTGMIFGTPTYMSPEQAQGQRVDHRSDIYALGVILYELLTGKVPFSADNFMGILTKHMFDEPVAPSVAAPHADISLEVEAIVLKCLQKDRAFRFQSMEELSTAILTVGTGARPVTVTPEARTRPISEGRPTAFLTHGDASPRARAAGEVTLADPQRSPGQRRGLMVALAAGIAVVAGSVVTLLALSQEDPPAAVAGPVAVVAPPTQPPVGSARPDAALAPTPDPPPVPPAAEPRIYVISNVAAAVIDASDGSTIGSSGEAGFLLPRAGGPRHVILRANGYEDLSLDLEPTPERRFDAELKPKKPSIAVKSGKPKPGETKSPKPDDPTPATPKLGDPKPGDPKPVGSMGLKNPFETRSPGG